MDPISTIPECVGIILDGNRRWAKAHNLHQLAGHREGLLVTYKNIAKHIRDRGIKHFVVYMFSTENWNRAPEEVSYLMDLFREAGKNQLKELSEENIRIRFIGQRERFAPDLQKLMADVEEESISNTSMTAWICLSYGGRAEITEAAKQLAAAGTEITEDSIRSHMWSAEMPDPDLIIRTSGEMRLSNFLLWQAAYSELFFTDTLWPDFTPEEFDRILEEYGSRERRRGK